MGAGQAPPRLEDHDGAIVPLTGELSQLMPDLLLIIPLAALALAAGWLAFRYLAHAYMKVERAIQKQKAAGRLSDGLR